MTEMSPSPSHTLLPYWKLQKKYLTCTSVVFFWGGGGAEGAEQTMGILGCYETRPGFLYGLNIEACSVAMATLE